MYHYYTYDGRTLCSAVKHLAHTCAELLFQRVHLRELRTAQQVAHGGLCRPVVRKLRLMLGQILFRIPGRLVAVKYRARLCVLHHRTHELGRVGERRLGVPQLPGQFVSPIHRRLGAG